MVLPSLRSRALFSGLAVAALSGTLLVLPAAPSYAAPCTTPVQIPGLPPLPPVCLLPPEAAPPMVSGEKKVGTTVTASEPDWDQPDVVTSYQWLRSGTAIPDATTATYELVGDDFGETISVRATGRRAAGLPGTTDDSEAFEPAKGDPIVATARPVLRGSSAVGGTLTTSNGQWGDPEPTYTYQWFRSRTSGAGAQPIPGATTTSYSPVGADAGRKIVARVVAERIGYEKGAAFSGVKAVPRASSTAALTLPRKRVQATQQAVARVVVRSRAGLVPTGTLKVFDGTRVLRTTRLGPGSGGAATFTLPRLKKGIHRLTARYVGDGAHLGTVSAVQVLTVTR